jgi:hypothetical protein
VPRTGDVPVPGQRDVNGLLDEDTPVTVGLELSLPFAERLPDGSADSADALPGVRPRGRRQRADLRIGQSQRSSVAGVRDPGRLELSEVSCGRYSSQRIGAGIVPDLLRSTAMKRGKHAGPTRR